MSATDMELVRSIADKNHLSLTDAEKIIETVYTEEELRKMNLVTQLRLIGRVKGVKSPTSKNMKELISDILAIQQGTLKPVFSTKGRKVKYVPASEEKQLSDTPPIDDLMTRRPNNHGETPLHVDAENVAAAPQEGASSDLNAPSSSATATAAATAETPTDTADNGEENTDGKVIDVKATDFLVSGILELMPDGYGFMRTNNYYQSKNDIYVSAQQIKRFNLREGDKLECTARSFDRTKSPSLIYIHTVNGTQCDRLGRRPYFNDFEAAYPKERIRLEKGADRFDFSLRLIDLVAPVGKGQRGLIVAPPKTGKTTLLKKIAQSVTKAYGDSIKVLVLLIDERPEEVTDFRESVPDAEVVYSTFDQTPSHHVAVAEMLLKNCKHRVEQGQDVLLLLDSITRLARAYNKTAEATGRTLTGGLDIAALETPKAFFGSARRVTAGGSLTILATALVDTGSRMDDIIYEEFKGTGNMEIHLNRALSDRRIFPAIDLIKSGTRHEEMLLTQKELEGMWMIRRKLARADNIEASLQLLDLLTCTSTNEEFIDMLKVMK